MKNSCKYYAVLNAKLAEEDKLSITALKTNMLVEVKLTEKCKINDISLDSNSATVHTYIHSTPLYLKMLHAVYTGFCQGLSFKHYSRTTVFIMFTQHFTS